MRSLQGTGVARNSAEAAHHLWQSVRKQNGSALVVLAGLYAQGDGVAKDCDQAKILLDAAARLASGQVSTCETVPCLSGGCVEKDFGLIAVFGDAVALRVEARQHHQS